MKLDDEFSAPEEQCDDRFLKTEETDSECLNWKHSTDNWPEWPTVR